MKKMDEMERNFADHSIRIAYMMMFLMLWSSAVFQHIRTGAWNFDFFVVNVVTVVQMPAMSGSNTELIQPTRSRDEFCT